MIGVQIDHLLGAKAAGQRRAPAFEQILGQQRGIAMLVDEPLGQAQDAPRRLGLAQRNLDPQRLLLKALALARVGAKQKRHGCRSRRHGQHPLQVEVRLQRRVLGARAQGQLQAVALAAKVAGAGGVAIDALVDASHPFFLAPLVVDDEGVSVQGHIAAGQGAKVHWRAVVLGRKQGQVQLVGHGVPGLGMGVHALAQGGTGGRGGQAQGALEELVLAIRLDGIKVVFALAEQAKIALDDVAVSHTFGAKGEPAIDQGIKADALEVPAHQSQTGAGGQVVGQLLDYEVGHRETHLQGFLYIRTNCLISIGNTGEIVDLGHGFR